VIGLRRLPRPSTVASTPPAGERPSERYYREREEEAQRLLAGVRIIDGLPVGAAGATDLAHARSMLSSLFAPPDLAFPRYDRLRFCCRYCWAKMRMDEPSCRGCGAPVDRQWGVA
jgi:hypothetical protein